MSDPSTYNQIHLYAPKRTKSKHVHPIIRPKEVSLTNTETLLEFLKIVFPHSSESFISLHSNAALIDIQPGLTPTIFENAADLIAAVPPINEWLLEWSRSDLRIPKEDPLWAVYRDISRSTVAAFAEAIRQKLATARRQLVRFYSSDGKKVSLYIPSIDALTPPRGKPDGTMTVLVSNVELRSKFIDPLGRTLLVKGSEDDMSSASALGLRLKQASRIRRVTTVEGRITAIGARNL